MPARSAARSLSSPRRRSSATSCCSTSSRACRPARRSIWSKPTPIAGVNAQITGTNDYAVALEGADVVIVTAGIPRKPGMSRDDLIATNAGVIKTVAENIKAALPRTPS